ncbi:MAG: hypothetical protein AAF280_15265 [Pseudomonadota bacterium]
MSDYEQSRYPRPTAVDTGGASAFWVLVVVVALGALILIMALGSATVSGDIGTSAEPAAAESAPAITPAEPESATTGAATGTVAE